MSIPYQEEEAREPWIDLFVNFSRIVYFSVFETLFVIN